MSEVPAEPESLQKLSRDLGLPPETIAAWLLHLRSFERTRLAFQILQEVDTTLPELMQLPPSAFEARINTIQRNPNPANEQESRREYLLQNLPNFYEVTRLIQNSTQQN